MIKKFTGLTASLVALVSTATAEVKIDEYLSLDGYATGAGVVTEGTPARDKELVGSNRVYDSALFALNGKYEAFTARVSLYAVDSSVASNGVTQDAGLLDAYVTYKTGNVAVTGGKYLGWLGYESFHSVNNAFISFSQATYASPYSTGAKVEYLGEKFSTGLSVRDSQVGPGGTFFEGDGEFSDDIGYEVYALYTGIDKLTLFAGAGYEDVDGGSEVTTYDVWASYALTDKFSLAAELSSTEDVTNYSWLLQGTYLVSDAVSVSGRLTGSDGVNGAGDVIGYGAASTYTLTKNFSLKGEVTKTDTSVGGDTFSYALQGIFKF
jgi:hypothetical protein